MSVEANPVPKIRAFNRRIIKVMQDMPEDYIYRTTMTALIEEQDDIVNKYEADLDTMEDHLGSEVEMHLRTLKRELRCARNLVQDQV